jgi:uncharacterized protein YgiM (DUF1202 family)
MPYTVVIAHRSSFPNPICFSTGDAVEVGRRDEKYPGWIWVKVSSGKEGWAPETMIEIHTSNKARALSEYNARELDTFVGERISCLKEYGDWTWVENEDGETGWIPTETITAA